MDQVLKKNEIRRLLSEYTSGRISEKDRQILLQAALQDQGIFETLLSEQPLADLMKDASIRAELRAALTRKSGFSLWTWWWRPWPITATATAMIALLTAVITQYLPTTLNQPAPTQIAEIAKDKVAPTPPPSGLTIPTLREALSGGAAEKRVGGVARSVQSTDQAASRLTPRKMEKGTIWEGDRDRLNRLANVPPAAIPLKAKEFSPPTPQVPIIRDEEGEVRQKKDEALLPSSNIPVGEANLDLKKAQAEKSAWRQADQSRIQVVGPPLTHHLEQRRADGNFRETPPSRRRVEGEVIRVVLMPERDGYLSVVEQLENGTYQLIFPPDGLFETLAIAKQPVLLPLSGAWVISSGSQHRLLAFFTAEPHGKVILPNGSLLPPPASTILEVPLHSAP